MSLRSSLLASAFTALLALSTAACGKPAEATPAAPKAIGAPVTATLSNLQGQPVALADYKGKKLYVKFWASWCPICLASMAEVEALAADTKDDVEVITIAAPGYLGEMDTAEFTAWAKARNYKVPVLLDVGGTFARSLGVDKYPSSAFIAANSTVLDVRAGQLANDWIVAHFKAPKAAQAVRSSRFPPNPNVGVDYSNRPLKDIYLAGGCFWGVEAYFARVYGVADAVSGYANGPTANPSYEQVIDGSGHVETVRVRYDPARVSLEKLLTQFFLIIDPTVRNRQGNDRGVQYRTGIYFTDAADRAVAEKVMQREAMRWPKPLVTELLPLKNFGIAEDYHQDYLEKNPNGYCHTDFSSLTNTTTPPATGLKVDPSRYSKPDDATLRKTLTPLQYAVTQKADTERAWTNKYWDNYAPGLYVDIVTGEPLFSSLDKYDSKCGWPSFTRALVPEVVRYEEDRTYGMVRTEVLSRVGNSHLGHVFDDGPVDRGGKRYCINSAAIRFVAVENLAKEGYGEFVGLFGQR